MGEYTKKMIKPSELDFLYELQKLRKASVKELMVKHDISKGAAQMAFTVCCMPDNLAPEDAAGMMVSALLRGKDFKVEKMMETFCFVTTLLMQHGLIDDDDDYFAVVKEPGEKVYWTQNKKHQLSHVIVGDDPTVH